VRRSASAGVALLSFLAGCSLPPLRGKAEIGKDPYAIFAADAAGGTDLFAVLPSGGSPIQLTYSPVEESDPKLSPDGGTVLFLRHERHDGTDHRTVWLLNLLSGTERELRLPAAWKAMPDQAAWSADGRSVYVRMSPITGNLAGNTARFAAPPASASPVQVSSAERAQADSSFLVLLGTPAFAEAEPCGKGLCTVAADGGQTPLASPASGAVRWGADSVGYFTGDSLSGRFEIRPLGPGRARFLQWSPVPARPRQLTFFPGRPSS